MQRLRLALLLGVFVPSCFAQELRVATVDLQRVLAGYHKAQEVARELRAKEVSFRKELDDLRLEGRKLAGEVDGLRTLSLDNALSASERAEKQKSFQSKLTDLQAFGVRYDQFKDQRAAELESYASRVNRSVLEEVMSATRSLGEKEGYHLILNANRQNPVASDVLFTKGVEDVTEKVLARLNLPRPALPSKSSDTPVK